MDTLLKNSAFMAKFEQSKLDAHARTQDKVNVLIDDIYKQMLTDLGEFLSLPPCVSTQPIKDETDCHLLTEIETVSPPTAQSTLPSTPEEQQIEPQPQLLIDHENSTTSQPTQTMTPYAPYANLQPILKPITIASQVPNNPTPTILREQVPSVKRKNLTPITLKLRNKSRKMQLGSTSTITSRPKTQTANTLPSSDWWLPEVTANPNEQNNIQNQNATISHNLSSTKSSSTAEPSIPSTETIQNIEATTVTPTVNSKPTEKQITLPDVAAIKIKEEPHENNNHNTIITRNMRNKRAVVNGPDDGCDCPECLNDQIKIKKEINESQMEIVDDNMDDANGPVNDAIRDAYNGASASAQASVSTSGHVSANTGANLSANASARPTGLVSVNSSASPSAQAIASTIGHVSANSSASLSAQASTSPSAQVSASTSRHVSANSNASPSAQASASPSVQASASTSRHVSVNSSASPSVQASANSSANTNTHYNPLITLESGSSASANSCVFTRVHLGPPSTSSQPGIFKIVKTVARASSANPGATKTTANLSAINQWSIINDQTRENTNEQPVTQNGTILPTGQPFQRATDKPTIITKFIVTFPNSPAQDGNSTSSMPTPSLSSSNTSIDSTTKANSITSDNATKCPETPKSPKQPKTPKPTHQCPKCNKKFLKTDILLTHIDSCIHNLNRKYICEVCQQEFGLKQSLTNHMKVHTKKEKPFSCRHCSKVFRWEGNLLKHQQTVHQKIRPYRCNWQDCRFGAFSRANLRRHIGSKHFNVPRDKQLRGETPDNYDPDKYIRKVTDIGPKERNKSKISVKN